MRTITTKAGLFLIGLFALNSSHAFSTQEWNSCLDRASTVSAITECDQSAMRSMLKRNEQLGLKIGQRLANDGTIDSSLPMLLESLKHHQKYAETYCEATEPDDDSRNTACMITALRLQGDLIEYTLKQDSVNAPKPKAHVGNYPDRTRGNAIGQASDFKKITAQGNIGEITSAMSKCPKSRDINNTALQPCTEQAGLIMAKWIYQAGLSPDKTLVKIFEEKDGHYWSFVSKHMGDASLYLILGLKSENGRNLMLKNGYISQSTYQLITKTMNKSKQ